MSAAERFAQVADSPLAVARGGVAVVPNDTTAVQFRALYIGVTGAVSVVGFDGNTVVFANVPGGTVLPIAVIKVRATGTTATSIVGLK